MKFLLSTITVPRLFFPLSKQISQAHFHPLNKHAQSTTTINAFLIHFQIASCRSINTELPGAFQSSCLLSMLTEFLLFGLLILSKHICQAYEMSYKTHRVPCSLLSADTGWVACSINQSDPVRFLTSSSAEIIQIELSPVSISTLTLPAYFLVSDRTENDLLADSSRVTNINWIWIDATRDARLKHIHIVKDTFANLVSTRIHFILTDCGQPVLEIDRHAFRFTQVDHVLVTYYNRTRTFTLGEYFSQHCLTNEPILFFNESDPSSMDFVSLTSTIRNQSFNSTRLIVNSVLWMISLVLSSLLIYVNIRQQVHCPSDHSQRKFQNVASPYEMTHVGTGSTVISASESSISLAPYIPWVTSHCCYFYLIQSIDQRDICAWRNRTLIYKPFIATQCSRALRRNAASEVLRWSESISYPW